MEGTFAEPSPEGESGMSVLNPLEQLAMEYAGKWKFIMSAEPITRTQSTALLETNGQEERLRINYTIRTPEPIRKDILIRRVLSLIAAEENRLYGLSDGEAIKEHDELKARQNSQFVTVATLD